MMPRLLWELIGLMADSGSPLSDMEMAFEALHQAAGQDSPYTRSGMARMAWAALKRQQPLEAREWHNALTQRYGNRVEHSYLKRAIASYRPPGTDQWISDLE